MQTRQSSIIFELLEIRLEKIIAISSTSEIHVHFRLKWAAAQLILFNVLILLNYNYSFNNFTFSSTKALIGAIPAPWLTRITGT